MEWISVKDDLPKEGVYVWVLYRPRSPIMEGTDYGMMRRITHKTAVRITLDDNGFTTAGEVTYWMHRLERPKQ